MRPDEEMRGSYITTFTGLKFYPLDPHDQDRYRIEDIAHALAHVCRWAGHTREFYSVAQHSVLMSQLTEDLVLKRWGLMHDSCEAYVGDMVRPLKKFYSPWRRIERRILEQVALKWGLPWPMPEILKTWDSQLLFTEARDLMPPGTTCKAAVQDVELLKITIKPLPPAIAKEVFLETFKDLFMSRGADEIPAPVEGGKHEEDDNRADPKKSEGPLRMPIGLRPEPPAGKVRKKKRKDV